jgi:hypothetical protein
MDENIDVESESGSIDRRTLLRRSAIGAGATGVMWAAPNLTRLSLRPDYAAAASGPACKGAFTATVSLAFGGPNSTTSSDDTLASCGLKAHTDAEWGDAALVFSPDNPATVVITVDKTAGPAGCEFTGPVTFDGFTSDLFGTYFLQDPPVVNANQIVATLWGDPNFEEDISIGTGGDINFGVNCT